MLYYQFQFHPDLNPYRRFRVVELSTPHGQVYPTEAEINSHIFEMAFNVTIASRFHGEKGLIGKKFMNFIITSNLTYTFNITLRPFSDSETLNFDPLTLDQFSNDMLHHTPWFFISKIRVLQTYKPLHRHSQFLATYFRILDMKIWPMNDWRSTRQFSKTFSIEITYLIPFKLQERNFQQ